MSSNQKMNSAKAFLLATRPKTLTAAIIPVLAGTAVSYGVQGAIRLDLSFMALLCAILIQIGTNFINDALDFKKGADTHERIGPKRVTQSGLLDSKVVFWGGIAVFLV